MKLRTVATTGLAFALGMVTVVALAMRKLINEFDDSLVDMGEGDEPDEAGEASGDALARTMTSLGYERGPDDGFAQVWRKAGGSLSYAQGGDFNPWECNPLDMLTEVVEPCEDDDLPHDDYDWRDW